MFEQLYIKAVRLRLVEVLYSMYDQFIIVLSNAHVALRGL